MAFEPKFQVSPYYLLKENWLVKRNSLDLRQGYGAEVTNKMNGGFCLWLTGLSASGKTTIARLMENSLLVRGLKVQVLDGDVIRTNLSEGLGFTRADREINLRRIAFVAELLVRHGIVVVVSAITPYQSMREEVRSKIGAFVEVYLNCPLEICIQRDPKGLYRKALAGQIQNFTGIDDPYETPEHPEIELKTHEESPERCLDQILTILEALKKIPSRPEGFSAEKTRELEKPRNNFCFN
jgi:adenylylsulfate kinase